MTTRSVDGSTPMFPGDVPRNHNVSKVLLKAPNVSSLYVPPTFKVLNDKHHISMICWFPFNPTIFHDFSWLDPNVGC